MIDQKFDTRFRFSYLHPKYFPAWLGIGLLGVLSFVPPVARDAFATAISYPLSLLPVSFRRKVYDNFGKAFPNLSEKRRQQLYREHIRVGLKVIAGYGELFFRSQSYIRKTFIVTGKEHLDAALETGKPLVFLGSHSWAVDHCGVYLSAAGLRMSTFMHTSRNQVYDWFMNKMRLKFGGKLYERSSGVKFLIRSLRDGYHLAFYPDEDLEGQKSLRVNFFASPKSTLVVLPRLARISRALVVPMFAAYNEKEHKYEVVFDAAFTDYPSEDLSRDLRLMNEAIEKGLRGREGQYMWFLRFYKDHPEEEQS